MAEKVNYKMFEYQGGYNSLDSNKSYSNSFTGYRIKTSELGAPTKPDTANQIQQVNQLLNQGIIPIEAGALSPEVFSQIPRQHFKEIDRMAKLTGAKLSVHAPIVEPSGMGEQGWSEMQRQLSERILNDAIEKSYELNSKGQVPITIHSSGIMGTEYAPDKEKGRKVAKLVIVDRESGKPIQAFEDETKYYPGGDGGQVAVKKYSPEKNLEIANATQWDNEMNQIEFQRENAEKIMDKSHPMFRKLYLKVMDSQARNKPLNYSFSDEERAHIERIHFANQHIEEAEKKANSDFSKAYALAKRDNDEARLNVLNQISKSYAEVLEQGKQSNPDLLFIDPKLRSQALSTLTEGLRVVQPKLFVPIEDFALEKSSQTFANVAFNAYEKFNKEGHIPKLNIENLPSGMAFSSLKDMDKLITESKDKFARKLMDEKGLSENAARRTANEVLGMTLDVGHLNIAKKQGFKDEDLLKEVDAIAKHVKHVHLTDNFGFSDSHLPPGMGNVPFKGILEKLDKAGFKGSKIVEAGGFVQHFQQSPYLPTLESFGSPMYSGEIGAAWNQTAGFYQNYSGGFGKMLPGNNYQSFGAGFSQLPTELGGEMGGGAQGSRFSGRGME